MGPTQAICAAQVEISGTPHKFRAKLLRVGYTSKEPWLALDALDPHFDSDV